MVCPHLADLDRYREQRLEKAETTQIAEHLAECAACRAQLAELTDHDRELDSVRAAWGDGNDLEDVIASVDVPGYELGHVIDAGGQGIVCSGVQLSTRRPVAIKLLRSGRLATERQRLRFEREIDLVAGLDHPGIVTIFDSGCTADGRDYLVMRHVTGETLDSYLAGAAPSIPAMVELFSAIVGAVSHAHQRGVIHRDLKPSNILVDDTGAPHLLDFGVARPRDDRGAVQTRTGEFLGTLVYAAPEQVCGTPGAVDVRTDIYALGVMLYEMLTGAMPYPVDGELAEIVQNIRAEAPQHPSALNRRLDRDLETIVLRMLAKEPARRYQSAAAVQRDLKHWQAGEAIAARADSTWYIIGKTIEKHRIPVAAAVIAVVALIAATVISLSFWRQAVQAHDDAVVAAQNVTAALADLTVEAEKLTATNVFLLGVIESIHPTGAGQDVPVRSVLEEAVEGLHSAFDGQPLAEADVRHAIGAAYRRLGVFEPARENLERAVALRRVGLGPDHEQTLESQVAEIALTIHEGQFDDAIHRGRALYDHASDVLGADHSLTITALDQIALAYQNLGRFGEVAPIWEQVLERRRETLGEQAPGTIASRSNLAWLRLEQGRYDDAEAIVRPGLTVAREVLGEANAVTLRAATVLALVFQRQGRYDEAQELYESTLVIQERTLGNEHPDVLLSRSNLGWFYGRRGMYDAAAVLLERNLDACRSVLGAEHRGTLQAMNDLAALRDRQGRPEEAAVLHRTALDGRRRTLGAEHPDTLGSMNNLAAHLYTQKDYAAAEPLWLEVLEVRERLNGADHPETLSSVANLAMLRDRQGRSEEAAAFYRRAAEGRRRTLGDGHPRTLRSVREWADFTARSGDFELGLEIYAELFALLRAAQPDDDSSAARTRHAQAWCLRGLERVPEMEALMLDAYQYAERADDTKLMATLAREMVTMYETLSRPEDAAHWRAVGG